MNRRKCGIIPHSGAMDDTLMPPELAFDRRDPDWDYNLTIAPRRSTSYQSSRHLAMCGTTPHSMLKQSASFDLAHQPLQEEARQALQNRASIVMCRSESDGVGRDIRPPRFSRIFDAECRMQSSPALLSSRCSHSRPPLPPTASSSTGQAGPTPPRTSTKIWRSNPPLREVEFSFSNSWDDGSWDGIHDERDTIRRPLDLTEDRQTPAAGQTLAEPLKKASSSTKKKSRRKKSSRRMTESMRSKSMLDDDTEWNSDFVDQSNYGSRFLSDQNDDTPSASCLSIFPSTPPREKKTEANSPSRKDQGNRSKSTGKQHSVSPKSVLSALNCVGVVGFENGSTEKEQLDDTYPVNKVENPSDMELRELRRELKFLKRWTKTPAQEAVLTPRRVRFERPLVTSVKHRPRTLPEEIPNLFFDEMELRQLEKDRANRILEEQFEVVAAEMNDGQMVVSVSFPKRLSRKELERYRKRTNPSGNPMSSLVAI